jgi:hypothetical protein
MTPEEARLNGMTTFTGRELLEALVKFHREVEETFAHDVFNTTSPRLHYFAENSLNYTALFNTSFNDKFQKIILRPLITQLAYVLFWGRTYNERNRDEAAKNPLKDFEPRNIDMQFPGLRSRIGRLRSGTMADYLEDLLLDLDIMDSKLEEVRRL